MVFELSASYSRLVFLVIRLTFKAGNYLSIKARANARNIVGQQDATCWAQHVACCCVLLCVVATCLKWLDEV